LFTILAENIDQCGREKCRKSKKLFMVTLWWSLWKPFLNDNVLKSKEKNDTERGDTEIPFISKLS
jgi:hypothetical protein